MKRLALLPLLALVFACSEQSMPTAPNDEALKPSFNFTNGPVHPGNSVVFRGAVDFVLWIGTDPARDLVSLNGLGTVDPAQSFICQGTEGFDIWEFQDAVTSGRLVSHAVMQNPTQHIYAGIGDFFSLLNGPQPCDALMLPRVAEGIGDHFRFNSNCVFGSCDKGGRTDGWRARGTLDDLVNGGQVRYTEEQRIVFNPQTGDFKVLAENIRLTPIGKP